jgi:hypothetical protein
VTTATATHTPAATDLSAAIETIRVNLVALPDPERAPNMAPVERDELREKAYRLNAAITVLANAMPDLRAFDQRIVELEEWRSILLDVRAEAVTEHHAIGKVRPEPDDFVNGVWGKTVRADVRTAINARRDALGTREFETLVKRSDALSLAMYSIDYGAVRLGGLYNTGALVELLAKRGVVPLPGQDHVLAGRYSCLSVIDDKIEETRVKRNELQQRIDRTVTQVG